MECSFEPDVEIKIARMDEPTVSEIDETTEINPQPSGNTSFAIYHSREMVETEVKTEMIDTPDDIAVININDDSDDLTLSSSTLSDGTEPVVTAVSTVSSSLCHKPDRTLPKPGESLPVSY